MKRLVAAIVLALASTLASAQETRAQVLQKMFEADGKKGWIIKDTGDKIDLGAGEGPIFEITLPELPHSCYVAMHPTAAKAAVLICFPKDETPKQETSQ